MDTRRASYFFFSLRGTLQTVDRYMNLRLLDIEVENVEQHPQLVTLSRKNRSAVRKQPIQLFF